MNGGLSRRGFLKLSSWAGASLVLGFRLDDSDAAGVVALSRPKAEFVPNAYLKIDTDGIITFLVHRSEMGQGVNTSISMLIAEELEVDLAAVHIEQSPPDRVYGDQVTGGSVSISSSFRTVRMAGAVARTMLIAAAAQIWGVDVATCRAEQGMVIHDDSGQQLSYGELVETAAALPVPDNQSVTLKDPADFKLIGQPLPLVDGPAIVTGRATYCSDIKVPGMLVAVVARCPVFGGDVASYDDSAALAIPGVRHVVQIDSGVAVVADDTWTALQGREALEITWDEGSHADLNSAEGYQQIRDGIEVSDDPNRLEAVYEIPFLAHATMEPMTCVADVRANECEIWAPTQSRQDAQRMATRATRMNIDQIIVHVPLIGGGFGRRLQVDYVDEAVQISKAVGAPIKLFWTREDDMRHDFYHQSVIMHSFVELDNSGYIQQVAAGGLYGVPTGAWRSVQNFDDAFFFETFVDEVAAATGQDPFETHLMVHSGSPREAVLALVGEKIGRETPLPEGWGRGYAAFSTFGITHVAYGIEVSVEGGEVRVHRVVGAVDCGTVVNPDTVKAQIEGGLIFGLSAALYGEITIENGRVPQSNFHDYPILRFDEAPEIEVYIIESTNSPTGIGEMGVPPAAPALMNAIYAASGKRIRHIPIRPEDLV